MNDDMERIGLEPSLDQSLHQALRGAVFPLSVQQLVWLARENEAPASVLTLLSGLPAKMFSSSSAVQQGVVALVSPTGTPGEPPTLTPASR